MSVLTMESLRYPGCQPVEPEPVEPRNTTYLATQGMAVGFMALENWQEQLRRGTLEMAVLLAVAPGRRYGLEILRHLEFTDLVLTEGVIYPILARLSRDGLLASEWVTGEGPQPRKYYKLTARGRTRLQQMCLEFRSFTHNIDQLIKDSIGDLS
jgi:PadR family transcriptional regulator PadR